MDDLKKYLRYYNLEDYLFGEVHQRFKERKTLSQEDFFAIVVWKSNRAKTRVRNGVKKLGKSIEIVIHEIDGVVDFEKVKQLTSIDGIGIPIASAILAVCYPDNFTVVDYRAKASLRNIDSSKASSISGDPSQNIQAYLDYNQICKALAAQQDDLSLRDFDRALWGYDFYAGKGGLKLFSAPGTPS